MAVDHQASERSARSGSSAGFSDRRASETKHSVKTAEFVAYVAAAAGVLIAAAVIGDGDNGSRGLAKAGSREPRDRSDA